jgi:hypothetical protein
MPKKLQDYEQDVQDLIDSFPDDQFIDLLDCMIDAAQVAKDARLEETEQE